jgi:hypothetical protein
MQVGSAQIPSSGARCFASELAHTRNLAAPENHPQDDAQHVILQRDAGSRTAQPPCPGALQQRGKGFRQC